MAENHHHADEAQEKYEIWHQKRGLAPQYIISFRCKHAVRSFMQYLAVRELNDGMKLSDDGPEEFSTYVTTSNGRFHFASFWCEEVLGEDEVLLDYEVEKSLVYAKRQAGSNPARYPGQVET